MREFALHHHIENAVIRVFFLNEAGARVEIKVGVHAEAAVIRSITRVAAGKGAAEMYERLDVAAIAHIFFGKNYLLRFGDGIIRAGENADAKAEKRYF